MAINYTMPKLAMAMNEGTINEWLVAEGDYVEKGQVLATVETEKVSYDVESPDSGFFHIITPVGETVDCEVLVGQFAESEDELAVLQAAATDGGGSVPAPVVAAVASAPAMPVTTGVATGTTAMKWGAAELQGVQRQAHPHQEGSKGQDPCAQSSIEINSKRSKTGRKEEEQGRRSPREISIVLNSSRTIANEATLAGAPVRLRRLPSPSIRHWRP